MHIALARALFISLLLVSGPSLVTSEDFDDYAIEEYRLKALKMFYHAYDGYMRHAFPYDELRPLTCDGHNTWGSYSLSLIDSLDMLAIVGNHSEFSRGVDLILENTDFNQDINVSVFETNIRVVGGLLSAHLLSKQALIEVEPGWPCQGPLLQLAVDVAKRLLPAFDTPTGMPYGTVNLRYGVPTGETPITCTAGVGTFLVEFGTLSRLTGDKSFESAAIKAMQAVYDKRGKLGLIGNHVNVKTGEWTAHDSGIGAGVDSYYEYLLKGGVLLRSKEFIRQLEEYEQLFIKYLKKEDWYVWVNMKSGGVSLPVFQSLEAFWPGLQALKGEIEEAKKTLLNYYQVWRQFGATPEFYNLNKLAANKGREGYPLRPELIESTMYLYQATRDPHLLSLGAQILDSIENIAKTDCGYAVIHDVNNHKLANRMESFFLAETTKYLYLLFDRGNFIHNPGNTGVLVDTPNGQCVLGAGGYIFNTEAHPMDIAALDCCSQTARSVDEMLQDMDLTKAIVDKDHRRNLYAHSHACEQQVPSEMSPTDGRSQKFDKLSHILMSTCRVEPLLDKLFIYGESSSLNNKL